MAESRQLVAGASAGAGCNDGDDSMKAAVANEHDSEQVVASRGGGTAGKAVVIGVVVVAIGAASFALWWNMARTRRALAFWGPANVRLIQQATKVELLELNHQKETELTRPAGEFLQYRDETWQIIKRHDLSQARGLVHARHALTDDASFEAKTSSATKPAQNWSHAVRFEDGSQKVTVLMDFASRRFAQFETGQEIVVIPKIGEGWQTFVSRYE